jgi:phosphatidylinositol alpha-1,6-mannosyltransferase
MSVPDASSVKILLVTNDFGPRAGGIETFVIGLLERMPIASTFVYTSSQGETSKYDARWLNNYGFAVNRDRSRILLPTPRVIRAVNRVISHEGITHLWFGAAAPLAVMVPFLKRKHPQLRTIALTHGHEVWWAKIPPFSLFMRWIGKGLDSIGYLTRYTKDEIAKGLRKEDRAKLIQIAPGIDIDRFAPQADEVTKSHLRQSLGLQGKRVMISVGRLVHRKGQDRLIDALPKVIDAIPEAHLLLVGEGPYREKLERRAERLGVRKSVTFVGRVQLDQLPIFLSLAELFAMPSRDRLGGFEVEGLGIVYLEASSCALPVIVGRSGGAPDALLHGETGLLVDGKDVQEVAAACIELLSDPVRASEMGAKGRAWTATQWNWDRWAGEFQASLLR